MALHTSRACAQELQGTGDTDNPRLKGTHRLPCALGPRAKQGHHQDLGQTYLQVLGGLLGKKWEAVAHWGRGGTLQEEVPGIFIGVSSPGGCHFGKIWPHTSGLRIPRQNNKQAGNISLPISKQAA